MENTSALIRLEHPDEQTIYPLKRITGFAMVRNLIDLITIENLEANPRNSKKNAITLDILESIEKSPDLMPFKSKGLLIGASVVLPRERNRFVLNFEDRKREGILDGGHNALAIGLAILRQVSIDDHELKTDLQSSINKIKNWGDLKNVWRRFDRYIKNERKKPSRVLDTLIPIEILTPADSDVHDSGDFSDAIITVCAARNHNTQLAEDALANQAGLFQPLKKFLPQEIDNAVQWKTNGDGRIDPRLLVSLSWVSLAKLDLPENIKKVSGQVAYSSKGEALKRYTELIQNSDISSFDQKDNTYTVNSPAVLSALKMIPDIIKVYDLIYTKFQSAYNDAGGSFGRIKAVKSASSKTNYAPFSNDEIKNMVPPAGYVMPIVYSLQALIHKKEDGTLEWIFDPVEFYSSDNNLSTIIGDVKDTIEIVDWDPQKTGKGQASYTAAYKTARNLVLEKRLSQIQ